MVITTVPLSLSSRASRHVSRQAGLSRSSGVVLAGGGSGQHSGRRLTACVGNLSRMGVTRPVIWHRDCHLRLWSIRAVTRMGLVTAQRVMMIGARGGADMRCDSKWRPEKEQTQEMRITHGDGGSGGKKGKKEKDRQRGSAKKRTGDKSKWVVNFKEHHMTPWTEENVNQQENTKCGSRQRRKKRLEVLK